MPPVDPARCAGEFLKEIHSHIYEAYQESPIPDDLTRILTVFRNLGEPADVASERLSASMVRSGAAGNKPLRILAALAAVLVAYYAFTSALLINRQHPLPVRNPAHLPPQTLGSPH
ncbi:MAG: hypothetical protein JST93_17255 [Acidobacteria bacterium]|nr:hypothetical protein [Acidobacteriota bacterium]